MKMMGQFRRSAGLSGPILLALLSTVNCSRPLAVPAESASNDDHAPFRDSRDIVGASSDPQTGVSSASRERAVPFHNSTEIPAGTLLNVTLQSPIAVGVPIANDSFDGVVEQSVVIEGNALIPRGTSVIGRVESVFISQIEPSRGYIRLALASVRMAGTDVPVQTTSVFARQASIDGQTSSTIRLEKGRRLTFRLIEPFSFKPQPTQASR